MPIEAVQTRARPSRAVAGSTTAPAPVPAAQSSARARVRLYGGLLGDCSLIRLPRPGGAPDFTILIDFGVIQNMAEGYARLPGIAKDIRTLTGDGRPDIIVATHRHWDHIYGFARCRAPHLKDGETAYADSAGEVWMSWVEDPQDHQGASIVRGVADTVAALGAAKAELGAQATDSPFSNLLDFVGDYGIAGLGAAGGGITTVECLEAVRAMGKPRYLAPGMTVALGDTGARAHVLGPPRNTGRLNDQEPSSDKHEVYPLAMTAANLPTRGDAKWPFARDSANPVGDTWQADGPNAAWIDAQYRGANNWRAIGDLATVGAEALAMKLDNIVNNTTLVLAIEIPQRPGDAAGTGDVLLFPGDAQVGNWLSWHEIDWPDGGDLATDLLKRTVFLKVAHHGSINATVKAGGLEAMTSPDLAAFFPVVQAYANEKKHWDMPHKPVLDRVTERAGGRIARGDDMGDGNGRFTVQASPTAPTDRPFFVDYAL